MRRLFLIVMFLMLAGAAAAGQNSGMIDIRKTSTAMLGYIASFGIAETDIERVTTIQIKEGGKRGGGRVNSLEYWLRLKSCRGFVVVEVDAAYRIVNGYSRGECSFDGLPSY